MQILVLCMQYIFVREHPEQFPLLNGVHSIGGRKCTSISSSASWLSLIFNSEAMCGVSQGRLIRGVSSTAAVLDGASGAMHSTFFVSGVSLLTSGNII